MEYVTDSCMKDLKRGGFRTTETYWVYIGFLSLLAAGILTGAIMGWRLDGHELERAAPGNHLDSETLYVNLGNSLSVELKSLEYTGLFVSGGVALLSYAMSSK